MLRNFFGGPSNTWWDLYVTKAAPEEVLKALAVQDRRGSTVVMRILSDSDHETAGRKILGILEAYLKQGVPSESILGLLSIKNAIGENCFHSLAHGHDQMMMMRWQGLLRDILDTDTENQKKNLFLIYEILNNDAAYYGHSEYRDKHIDRIGDYEIYSIDTYVVVVLKMAQLGLPRNYIEELLAKEQGTLWPAFWAKVSEYRPWELVDLFKHGFFKREEYPLFVEQKENILNYILELDEASERRNALKLVLDGRQPLGQLFLLKSQYEYRDISATRGLLGKALTAINTLSFKESAPSALQKFTLLSKKVESGPEVLHPVPSPVATRIE